MQPISKFFHRPNMLVCYVNFLISNCDTSFFKQPQQKAAEENKTKKRNCNYNNNNIVGKVHCKFAQPPSIPRLSAAALSCLFARFNF